MRNPSLDDLIAEYLTAIESGEQPERERLIADHPHLAGPLRDFFADLDQMNRVVMENLERTQDFTPLPSSLRSQLSNQNQQRLGRLLDSQQGTSKRIGNYKLLQRIGIGGMGEVWMAEQEKPVRRRVAIKLIKAGMDTRQVVARFEAERQALAMMDHQNIAKVLDAGTTDDHRPYFVMELVQGIPINKYCDQNKLSIEDRLNLFIPICNAIQHAHQKGIIHRDLKPSNILVTLYDGRPVPKVIDFGLAKALQHQSQLTDKTLYTEFGQVVGTLQYMSPEQAEMNALDIDTRTDVYALGVILYELLTGSTPIDQETLKNQAVLEVLESIREIDPPRPSARLSSVSNQVVSGISEQRQINPGKLKNILRGELDWIIMKAIEKDRSRRYETANGFARDVAHYLNGEAVTAKPPSALYSLRKYVKRNRLLVASLSTVFLTLLVGLVGVVWFARQAQVARVKAERSEANANAQRELAISTLKSVVTDLQRGLADLPGSSQIRRNILDTALKQLESASADFLANGDVDLSTARALYDMASIILTFGVEKSSEDSSRSSATALAEVYYNKSLAMLTNLSQQNPDDHIVSQQLIDTKRAIADLYKNTGRITDALTLLNDVLSASEILVHKNPSNSRILDKLSTVHIDLGHIHMKLGDRSQQESHCISALKTSRQAFALNPKDRLLQYRLALSLRSVSYINYLSAKLSDALAFELEAQAMFKRLSETFPDNNSYKNNLAVSLLHLAMIYQSQGKYIDQEDACRQAVDMKRQIAEQDSNNRENMRELAFALERLGDARCNLQQYDEAMTSYQEYASIRKSICDADPSNLKSLLDFWYVHDRITRVLIAKNQNEEAIERLQEALSIANRLAELDPAYYEHKEILARTLLKLGRCHLALEQLDCALDFLTQCRSLREMRLEAQPDDSQNVIQLIDTEETIANILMRTNRKREAVSALQSAVLLLAGQTKTIDLKKEERRLYNIEMMHNHIAYTFLDLGLIDDALVHIKHDISAGRELHSLNPTDGHNNYNLLLGLQSLSEFEVFKGDIENARSDAKQAIEFATRMISSGLETERAESVRKQLQDQLVAMSKIDLVLGEWNQLKQQSPEVLPPLLTMRCFVLYRRGRYEEAVDAAIALAKLSQANCDQLYTAATVLALCATDKKADGSEFPDSIVRQREFLRDLAVKTIKAAVAKGYSDYQRLGWEPDLDSIRNLPEFAKILNKTVDDAPAR